MTSRLSADKNRRHRWCLTLQKGDLNALPSPAALLAKLRTIPNTEVRCAVVGAEMGGQTERAHLQAYVEFAADGITLNNLKSGTYAGLHAEVAKGSRADNWTYCTKDGKFVEYHKPSTTPTDVFWQQKGHQGTRTDLIAIREHFQAGGTEDDLVWDDNKIRYLTQSRVIPKIMAAVDKRRPPKTTMTQVMVLWGKAGTGKSAWAEAHTDSHNTFFKDQKTEWWCGLQPHMTTLWIDEMGPDTGIPLSTMKQLLNPESPGIPINIKGIPTRTHIFHKIVMTSNYSPRTGWYPRAADDSGLRRRVETPTGSVTILQVNGNIWEMDPPLDWPPVQQLPDFLLLKRTSHPHPRTGQPIILADDSDDDEPTGRGRAAIQPIQVSNLPTGGGSQGSSRDGAKRSYAEVGNSQAESISITSGDDDDDLSPESREWRDDAATTYAWQEFIES